MRRVASDLLATVSIALTLGGVNEHNPYQLACLGAAFLLGAVSYIISTGEPA